MIEQFRDVLTDAASACADTRLHYCDVEVKSLTDGWCVLSGTVLDTVTLAALTTAISARFPDVAFDVAGVQILRIANPVRRVVATNLTGLYAKPSFRAEQVSQLLNGVTLEPLMAEDSWLFVRQDDGYLGWVYAPYLDEAPPTPPKGTHVVYAPVTSLRREPQLLSSAVSRVLGGTVVTVDRNVSFGKRAYDAWAHLTLAGGRAGWLSLFNLRGLDSLPQDEPALRRQIVEDARIYMGVPYLWGGSSGMGIDCSGLAQLAHHLVGITLPRDADMQFDAGRPVEPPFQPGDLLFFGSDGAQRRITHVGISLGGWRIIHASRAQNGVYEDDVETVDHLRKSFMGARTFVDG